MHNWTVRGKKATIKVVTCGDFYVYTCTVNYIFLIFNLVLFDASNCGERFELCIYVMQISYAVSDGTPSWLIKVSLANKQTNRNLIKVAGFDKVEVPGIFSVMFNPYNFIFYCIKRFVPSCCVFITFVG